jgi:aspartate/methionine/tyrosine aminotransferase
MITNTNEDDIYWRSVIAECCGGSTFDAPGGGYSFSNVLNEERQLITANIAGDPRSALCKLSIADPTWKMPIGAMAASMEYYHSSRDATRYTDLKGIPGTHETIAEFLNKNHPGGRIQFTPDWVQYSPGSIKRLLGEYTPSLLFDKATHLFFPTPGYGVMKDPINKRDAVVHDVPLVFSEGRWHIDRERISSIIAELPDKGRGIRKVLYVNMPHNPTGNTLSHADWTFLIMWAVENRIILIVDEAYIHLRFNDGSSVLDIPGWERCCIVFQSVSKGWNATGLRFGYAVAHPSVIKALRKVMDVKDSGGFGPSIAAGLWCLKNREFADGTRDLYRGLHETLFNGLKDAGFDTSMPEAGLCQFTPAPRAANGTVFANVTECAQFFRKEMRVSIMSYGLKDRNWLRWAVTIAPVPECGLPDEAAVIAEVVRRLKSVKLEF